MRLAVLGDINWAAVVVAAAVYFGIGGLWYSPLAFARAWVKASGVEMPTGGPAPTIFLAPLLGGFVASLATAMLAIATGSDSILEGIVLGLVLGIGFAVTLLAVTVAFDPQKADPLRWLAITAGYHVVSLVAVALIVSLWR